MSSFNVLSWPMLDSMRNFCPVGIKILKFQKKDIICVWFDSSILIYYNVELDQLQNENNPPEHVYPLSVEGTIVDVLQLGEVVGVFNKIGLYILKSKGSSATPSPVKGASSFHTMESLDLKLHMKMHQVLALGALESGFVLIKKKLAKLYVDIYKSGPKLHPFEKKMSIYIPQLVHDDVSCILTSVLCDDLDPVFGSLIVEDLALMKSQIIFVGLGCGQVYSIPVMIEGKILPTPKILYNCTQSIKAIVCLKDEKSKLCTQVGIFFEGSPMVHITTFMQKLYYQVIYLPASVETYCLAHQGIILADDIDLWYSKFCMNNKKIMLENRKVGVKGICAICPIPNSECILGITRYLTLYSIHPEMVMSSRKNKHFSIPPNAMSNIDNLTQLLARLKEEMLFEEKIMEAISISMRDSFLQNTFTIDVEVHSKRQNNVNAYIFEIILKNSIDQDYSPEIWNLHVHLKADTMEVTEIRKIEQRIRKGISIKTTIVAEIPECVFSVTVSCRLIAKFSDDREMDNVSWGIIPIASTNLDVSYFFLPSPISSKTMVTEDFLKIAQSYMGEDKDFEWKQDKEQKEYTYVCRILSKNVTSNYIWTAVVKNSRHNFTDIRTGREMDVFVSSHHIKMSLNEDCNAVFIKCFNLKLLHHVKSSLLHLLKEMNPQDFVYVSRDLFTKTQELKENMQLEGEDLEVVKQSWRDTIAKHLPLV